MLSVFLSGGTSLVVGSLGQYILFISTAHGIETQCLAIQDCNVDFSHLYLLLLSRGRTSTNLVCIAFWNSC